MYGGEISGREGRIASPNYPRTYPNGVTYNWVVTTDVDSFINVDVIAMGLEYHRSCVYDFLMVSWLVNVLEMLLYDMIATLFGYFEFICNGFIKYVGDVRSSVRPSIRPSVNIFVFLGLF